MKLTHLVPFALVLALFITPLQASAALTTIVPDGLVSHLTFDTPDITGSTVFDASGKGNAGTIIGTKRLAPGKSGTAFVYDGTNTVSLGKSSFGLDQSFTVSFWMNRLQESGISLLVLRSPSYPFEINTIDGDDYGKPVFGTRTSENLSRLSSTGVTKLAEWHHIVASFDKGERKIYLDGKLIKSDTVPGTIRWVKDVETFVGQGGGDRAFRGLLDDVRVYNRGLSDAEVATLYNAYPAAPKPAAPVVTLTPSATSVASGGSVTLSWSSVGGLYCTASGNWSGLLDPSGSRVISNVTQDMQFNLNCSGLGGSSVTQKTVRVSGAATPALADNPIPGPRVLVAGSGWNGSTLTPAARSMNGQAGADENAIARWDTVPFQTFGKTINVGVVAFHMNDIEKVEFSANGGPWYSVTEMTTNPETGVKEYWVTLDASRFKDGEVEVRAIAYPKVGVPRVLQGPTRKDGQQSLVLYANAGGSLKSPTIYVANSGSDTTGDGTSGNPFGTIDKAVGMIADGGFIVLTEAGTYAAGTKGPPTGAAVRDNKRWITIMPRTGLSQNEVIITAATPESMVRTGGKRMRWYGVTFDFSAITQYYNEASAYVWFDHARWTNLNGGWYDMAGSSNTRAAGTGGVYVTDSLAENLRYGFTNIDLLRNSKLQFISGDALQNTRMIVNTSVRTMTQTNPNLHMDLLQNWGGHENGIYYGLTASDIRGQGVFWTRENGDPEVSFRDMAMVDTNLQVAAGDFSQSAGVNRHLVFRNFSLYPQKLLLRTDVASTSPGIFKGTNVVYDNCALVGSTWTDYVSPGAKLPPGVSFRNCRNIDTGAIASSGKAPALPPTLALSSDKTTVASSGSTSLTWTSTNASSCTAEGAWTGAQSVTGTRTLSSLMTSGTYTLTCAGEGGTVTKSVAITVQPPVVVKPPAAPLVRPVITFSQNPAPVLVGSDVTLTWSTKDATSCTGEHKDPTNPWNGPRELSGSIVIPNVQASSHYIMRCKGGAGNAETFWVTAKAPAPVIVKPTVIFAAEPIRPFIGASVTFTWSTENATSCIGRNTTPENPFNGERGTSGTFTVENVTVGQHYVLSCTGPSGGTNKTIWVGVQSSKSSSLAAAVYEAMERFIDLWRLWFMY